MLSCSIWGSACETFFEEISAVDLSTIKGFRTSLSAQDYDPFKINAVILKNGKILRLGKLLGSGHFSVVYCVGKSCDTVIKIPRDLTCINSLGHEIDNETPINSAGIRTAKILNTDDNNPLYLQKERITGPTGNDIIQGKGFSKEQITKLAEIFVKAFNNKLAIDANKPENFIWDPIKKAWYLVDNYMLDDNGESINGVNINLWMSNFSSGHPSFNEIFNKKIISIVGEEGLYEIEEAASRSMKVQHAIRHDPMFF